MQQLESRMEAEKARIAEFSQSKQDELNQRLQQAILDVQEAEKDLKEAEALVLEKKKEVSTLRAQGDETEREIQTARNSVMGLREQIKRCVDQQNNSLAPYGQDLKNVLERIGRMRWHGQKPLGPFGVYVKVKDRECPRLSYVVLRRDGQQGPSGVEEVVKGEREVCRFYSLFFPPQSADDP